MVRRYQLIVGYLLFQTIGAFSVVDRLIYGEWDLKSGDKLSQALNVSGIVASLVLFSHGYRKVRRIDIGGWLLILLAMFLMVSSVWSVDPQTTARRSVEYLFFVLGAIGMAGSLEGDDFIRVFGNVCLVSALLSIVFVAVSPGVALMPGGAVRGVFSHKSVLGQAMAMGALISLYRIRIDRGRRIRSVVMLTVFTGMTIASQSMTSLLVITALSCVETVTALLRRGGAFRFLGMSVTLVLVPALVVGALFPDQLLELLGKDPTLTGRAQLWDFVEQAIAQRPLLGWGLLAFWSAANPAAAAISAALGWTVPQAHNGLLEMLLDVGVTGTCIFVLIWLRIAWLATRCLRAETREVAISLLMCCGGILFVGATESVLVDPAQPAANMLFVVGLICERTLRVERRRKWPTRRPASLASARRA